MRPGVFVPLLAGIAIAAFLVGRYLLAPAPPADRPATPPAQVTTAGDVREPDPIRGASSQVSEPPRFTPPPIPNDPGLAKWLASGSPIPTPEMIAGRNQGINERLDELFGQDFPAEKRAKVLAAQEAAMRRSAQFSWDYYHGAISSDDFATQLHQTVLIYGHDIEGALDRDEYREFMSLEVGVDPYSVLANPGMEVGEPLGPEDGPAGQPLPE